MIRLRITPPLDADVIIAGGGPAGASAAARLAAAGVRVLLLDRQRFPRDKVCGDFVGPAALVELNALGVAAREGYRDTNVIREAALHLDGEELIHRPLPECDGLPAYGRCIPRQTLDYWVLDAARRAGAAVREGVRVTGYDVHPNGVTVAAEHGRDPLRLRARLLIGADGSSSTGARALRGRPPRDADRIIAVRAYYEGDGGPEDRADLFFTAESFPGYYWLFPTGGGHANVGLGMVLETMPRADDHLRELMLRLVASDAALNRRLTKGRLLGKVVGWPLTTYDPSLPIVGDRALLVGDAAGFINPLNGEGIQYALVSGRWAADTAVDALAADDWSEARLAPYAERARRELRYDMALAGLVVQFIRNRHLNDVWLAALRVILARARADDAYAEITGGILAGLVPARDALSLTVLGRTLDQAIYSAGLGLAWNALKGPRHLARQGLAAAKAGAVLADRLRRDPDGFIDWAAGLAQHGGELAAQFSAHVGRQEPSAAFAAPPALDAPVRLRIPPA